MTPSFSYQKLLIIIDGFVKSYEFNYRWLSKPQRCKSRGCLRSAASRVKP